MTDTITTGSASTLDTATAPVAIIGWGTAGVNAAIGLRTSGYTGPIQVFSDTNIPPYSPILTSYYAGGEKSYEQCFPWSEADLSDLQVDVQAGHPVEHLDATAHRITTAAGDFPYAKCVIATGSRPMCYGFPQVEGYSPLVLRTMDDAERLKTTLEDPTVKTFLVSGASMVALKTLEAALARGKQVTLVGMNPHVLDFNALPAAAERFEGQLRKKGVQLRLGMTIQSVDIANAPEGKLHVTFSDGSSDYFDAISVAHGMRSNLEFIDEDAFEMNRALLVDEFMRTSDPDVYAAGDVAAALELISGQQRVVGIWKNAAVQGYVAGSAIAAELAGQAPTHPYRGSIATNTIVVDGTLFTSAGTMELAPDRYVETRETPDMTVLYIYEQRPDAAPVLVGYNLVCDVDEPGSPAYDTGAMLTLRIEAAFR